MDSANIRNVAIIAHVDHGKTTLVDGLLKQSGVFRENEKVEACVLDSNDLERERGITILAKNTAVRYGEHKINIVDTPGHADFGGEVERVLGMVDGCLLIVDAFEGPMPQTRFVLRKALERKLRPIVVLNKMDRPGARPHEVLDRVLDLFIDLGADDDQIEFPTVFASGIRGIASHEVDREGEDLRPLFESILTHIPAPDTALDAPVQLQVTTLDYSEYLGRIVIGRIERGTLRAGQQLALMRADGTVVKNKVSKLYTFLGLNRVETTEARAGDIVAVAGFPDANIGETLCDVDNLEALPLISIDEPTLQMAFSVNDSPFAGQEGKFVTSRQIRERLNRELERNVSLRVEETDTTDSFMVSGRGELHLGILVETMRREGYEFQISKPRVIFHGSEEEGILEPYERLVLDVPDGTQGSCIERLGSRRADMVSMVSEGSRQVLEFEIPARGLIGFRSDFIRVTRGEGIMTHSFVGYRPHAGDIGAQRNGVLIAFEQGDSTAYAIQNLEDRGLFFIAPGTRVYAGMIVGEHNRPQDLEINVCRAKKVTNMRSAGGEELVRLTPPQDMPLERAMEYIQDDELVEVTPQSIRLRKQRLKR